MTFYLSGNLAKPTDLKSALTAISMGNIGATQIACGDGSYVFDSKLNDYKTKIELQCSYGVLDGLKDFGQLSAVSFVDCPSYQKNSDEFSFPFLPQQCNWQKFSESERSFIEDQFKFNCVGQSRCDIKFNQKQLPSKCAMPLATALNWQYVLSATCKDQTI